MLYMNYTLDDLENQDYDLLMEILNLDDEKVANDEVIENPLDLLKL